jgi:protein-L-isoaspartate(D-aspartate) O-methyltransferase
MPRFLAEQLVSGGVLLAPLMTGEETCMMVRLTKTGSRFDREDLFEVPYLPLVPKIASFL